MLEQELRRIWNGASKREQVRFDLSRLLIELNNRMEQFEKSVRRRDTREIAAAVVAIVIFGYFAIEIPFPITKAACVFAVLWACFVIHKFRSAQLDKLPNDEPLSFRAGLEVQKGFVVRQQRLLDSVLYWCVLPAFLMNVVFVLGIGNPEEYQWSPALLEWLPLTAKEKISTLISCALFYAFVVWINRKTARRNLKPLIHKIENLQKELDNG